MRWASAASLVARLDPAVAEASDVVRGRLGGDAPRGGFVCNGEIGPVHGTTFAHGDTSAFRWLRSRGR